MEIVIQGIVLNLCFVAVANHILQDAFVIDGLNELMDTFCHRSHFLGQRGYRSIGKVVAVFWSNLHIPIHIVAANQIAFNLSGCVTVNHNALVANQNNLALEEFCGCGLGTVIQIFLNIGLQRRYKVLVALAGNNRQHIQVMHRCPTGGGIHAVAVLIDTQTQTSAYLLTFGNGVVGVLQGANLEDIWIVPAFPQSGVGEDEAGRFLEGQQPLLVFQNQFVGRNIVRKLAAFFGGAVDAAARLLVDAEITTMDFGYIIPGGFQVSLVGRVEQLNVVVGNINVLLLKHFAVFAQDFIAVLVILAIFGDFINEEQREGLDASGKQLFFLLKVGNDGLTNLDTAHILLRHITHHIPFEDGYAIGKGHSGPQRVNFGDNIALILFHLLGGGIQAVPDTQDTGLTVG